MGRKKKEEVDPKKRTDSQWEKIARPIYEAYPRHTANRAAILKIKSAILRLEERMPSEQVVPWLLGRVAVFAESQRGREKCYIPHAATWFNQGRYDDDDEEWGVWKLARGGPREDPDVGWELAGTRPDPEAEEQEQMRAEMREAF